MPAPAGVARVAIVDIDVHHGNGTQETSTRIRACSSSPRINTRSIPGTGAALRSDAGPGEGFTVNMPIEAAPRTATIAPVFERVVVPVLRRVRAPI